MTDLTFFYIADGPRLQIQALLLARSLQLVHPRAGQIAYVPAGAGPDLPAGFREALAGFGAECRELPPPGRTWKTGYPHGNKILAAAEPRDSRWSVFLDTDMMAVAPLREGDLPGPMEVSVVPEGILGWGVKPERWERVYGHFGLPVPEERIRLLRGAKQLSPPYFNAGFIATNEAGQSGGKGFGALWRDTASEIDWQVSVGAKRPWLDQASLPVAMARFGFVHKIVGERNNTSISNGRRFDGLDPAILHYHRAAFLRRWPGAEERIAETIAATLPGYRDRFAAALEAAGFTGDLPPDECPPVPDE